MANFWAVVIYIAVIYDFIKDNAVQEFLAPLAAIYIAVLTIYASDKEFERWHHFHQARHPGELFVIVWTALMAGILLADFLLSKLYKLPSEIISVYIVVLSILAITRKSKSLHREKEK